MGTLIAAMIANTALRRARSSGSPFARRSAKYPSAKTSMMAVEVSRASQAHQTPHVGRPQIEPVMRVSAIKTALTSMAQYAMRSMTADLVRFQRYKQLAITDVPKET